MTIDLQHARQTAEDIAQKAADVLMHYFEGPLTETLKGGPFDVVTEADKEAEAVIVKALTDAYPTHHIVGEEGGGMGAPIEDAAYRWYVDPIDGTVNYANRFPHFSISIALADQAMNPLVGVVYNPVMDEIFSAVIGGGATLNGEPIQVSKDTKLETCIVTSGFPYDKHTNPNNNLKEWGRFVVRTRGIRRLGSAALDFCYVAAGRLDGYWEPTLNSWDLMGGVVCVLEAGGQVTDYAGNTGPMVYERGQVVASNGHIHQQMLDLLTE